MNSTSDMVKSLDLIIAVLVVLAASLSFVVLYNLSNINITERKRESASAISVSPKLLILHLPKS